MLNVAKPRLIAGFAVLLALIALNPMFYVWDPLPLQLLRNATFDQFQRLKPREFKASSVTIIDIDDESLNRLGQWPWPRSLIAELLTKLQASKPALMALDIIFAEKDRTSPQAMSELWQLNDREKQTLAHLPDHDAVLADTLRQNPTVLGFALNQTPDKSHEPRIKSRFVEIGDLHEGRLHQFRGAVASLPALQDAAAGNGALSFISDADGVIRKLPLLMHYDGIVVPSMVLDALRLLEHADNVLLRSHNSVYHALTRIDVGHFEIPTDASGNLWLYYTPHENKRYLPAWQVMSGQIATEQLKDHILLIGTSALGLMDQRFSPLGSLIPGIEVQAQALEQIFSGELLTEPVWRASAELLFLISGGLVLGIIVLKTPIIRSSIAFMAILAVAWLGAWHAFAQHRLLIDPLVPSAMLLLIFVSSSVFRHIYIEQSQAWIKHAFSRYISPNRVEFLVNHPDELELGGQRRQCSFVFTDLEDFTSLMENIDPADAVGLLNTYLENMITIAFAHQGTLDRIVGDSVAIMFSAPVRQPDHQQRALDCALAMHDFADNYSRQCQRRNIAFGRTRIGVHSGEVIVGNFGGKTIFDYRALGDTVNTASRLEGANKYLGTTICVSEATLAGCRGVTVRPIGRLLLKGKINALKVFEPLASSSLDVRAFDDYQTAYRLLFAASGEALAAFRRLAERYPSDPLAALHLARLRAGETGDGIELRRK